MNFPFRKRNTEPPEVDAEGVTASDLSDELKRLTGKQPVVGPWNPPSRWPGAERFKLTGVWLVSGESKQGELYVVSGPSAVWALLDAINRALQENRGGCADAS